jgi:UDP-N-acetylmuramate--alanine ligase
MYQIDFNRPGHVYFVGIGGISMSGLAEILALEGFRISGSDSKRSFVTAALERKGISVIIGQRAENIGDDIDCAVLTSAIREDNPEFAAIRSKNIPVLTRAQLLGQLMQNYEVPIAVSGTHGKTTTTSMIGDILLTASYDPTISVGGMMKSIGGNLRIGSSAYFVTEACEYTNSFLSLFPRIGIILNIEADHLDFFKDLTDIYHSFRQFAQLIPSDGTLIINGDIPFIEEITKGLTCRVITFGQGVGCDYYAESISFDSFGHPSFLVRGSVSDKPKAAGELDIVTLQVPGAHNIANALAALALADVLDVPRRVSVTALDHFSGTERRFEVKGSVGGVTIVDDYAHHPTEIAATLSAASHYDHKKLWCVFQPHTYSRTKAFLKEFAAALSSADYVVLADIYAARETDTLGISSEQLLEELQILGKSCSYFATFDEIENFLLENCTKGDLLITMGAGDVNRIGEKLLGG